MHLRQVMDLVLAGHVASCTLMWQVLPRTQEFAGSSTGSRPQAQATQVTQLKLEKLPPGLFLPQPRRHRAFLALQAITSSSFEILLKLPSHCIGSQKGLHLSS